jgi:hypothetical protein
MVNFINDSLCNLDKYVSEKTGNPEYGKMAKCVGTGVVLTTTVSVIAYTVFLSSKKLNTYVEGILENRRIRNQKEIVSIINSVDENIRPILTQIKEQLDSKFRSDKVYKFEVAGSNGESFQRIRVAVAKWIFLPEPAELKGNIFDGFSVTARCAIFTESNGSLMAKVCRIAKLSGITSGIYSSNSWVAFNPLIDACVVN